MRANEIKMELDGFIFNANDAKGHYKFVMQLGRCIPTTKAQARFFIKDISQLDCLNKDDALKLNSIMSEFNLIPLFKYTKSKRFVRLINLNDLKQAYKLKFGL